MDEDSQLPPVLVDPVQPTRRALPLAQSRKRHRSLYESTDSSDPALFSSDSPSPSAEDYSSKRRKNPWPGTWWAKTIPPDRFSDTNSSRSLQRNFDSGIWMGSDETESSIDEDFLKDNPELERSQRLLETKSVPTRGEADSQMQSDYVLPARLNSLPEPPALTNARRIIATCVEWGQERIDLSCISMESLPADLIQPLKSLTRHSHLQGPPASQEAYSKLEAGLQIYLAANLLTKLPGNLFTFDNLRVLSLRHNNLTELPPAIGRLKNLAALNISYNKLRYLPFELLELCSQLQLVVFHAHPNPWCTYDENDRDSGETEVVVSHSSRRLKRWRIAHTKLIPFHLSDTAPSFSSPPSSASLLPHQPSTAVPSLAEVALRNLTKSQYFSKLPEALSDSLPENAQRLLTYARDVHESGGQHCTGCHRDMTLPRKQWIEWHGLFWNSTSLGDGPGWSGIFPFLRRACGNGRCVPTYVSG